MNENVLKVSILMPCYNGEKTVERAICGVINQTYRPIELVFINDGSIDDSEKIVKSMENKLKEADIEFKYIYQNNLGLGGAINTGLKYFTGEYLAWIDADDELLKDSIERKVNFLNQHPEMACVSSNAYFVKGDDWDNPIGLVVDNVESNQEENQFYKLLLGKSVFCSGCHLVRTTAFDYANPTRSIYPARHGQNWQMLLPVYYHFKHGFIDEPLYKYGIYSSNMTAIINSMTSKQLYERREEYLKIVHETLVQIPNMSLKEQKKAWTIFQISIKEQNMYTAIGEKDLLNYIRYVSELFLLGQIRIKYIIYPLELLWKKMKGKK